MPFFTGVANSLSIYKNLHTMVAAKASADDGVVMGQGPFSMNEVPLGFFVSILSQKNTSSLGHLRGTLSPLNLGPPILGFKRRALLKPCGLTKWSEPSYGCGFD